MLLSRRCITFQSTLPVWGATAVSGSFGQLLIISIHAPRVGSDAGGVQIGRRNCHFNPRSPCGERHEAGFSAYDSTDFNPRSPCGERPVSHPPSSIRVRFQSTLPVWGATRRFRRCRTGTGDFNPRSPCGERRGTGIASGWNWVFQSTLPVWGATGSIHCAAADVVFQSTLPVWGATIADARRHVFRGISIHAPRVGSDFGRLQCPACPA